MQKKPIKENGASGTTSASIAPAIAGGAAFSSLLKKRKVMKLAKKTESLAADLVSKLLNEEADDSHLVEPPAVCGCPHCKEAEQRGFDKGYREGIAAGEQGLGWE